MSRSQSITKAELNRVADVAEARNMTIEVERAGTIYRVTPPRSAKPTVDETQESALDRELAEFDRKNGYN